MAEQDPYDHSLPRRTGLTVLRNAAKPVLRILAASATAHHNGSVAMIANK